MAVRKGKDTYFTGWMWVGMETDRSVQGRQWLRVGDMNCSHLNASWHADGYATVTGVRVAVGSISDVGLVTHWWEECKAEVAHYAGGRKRWSGPECGTWVPTLQPPLMMGMSWKPDDLPNQTWPWETQRPFSSTGWSTNGLWLACLIRPWARRLLCEHKQ